MTTYSVKEVFKRLKSLKITSNEESVRRWLRTGKLNVLLEEAIREQMWYEIVHRNIFEGLVEIKKSRLKECIDCKHYSKDFFSYCWNQLNQKHLGCIVPRVPYLLDSFLYDSQKIKMDDNYEMLEEQVIFALIEYLRVQKIKH